MDKPDQSLENNPMLRSTKGLPIVVGVLTMLAGVAWLFLASHVWANYSPTESLSDSLLFHSIPITFSFFGLFWGTLGFGSTMLRKWACKLLLASGWLLIALCSVFFLSLVLWLPLFYTEFSSTSIGVADIGFIVTAYLAQIFILIIGTAGPGALLVFVYKSKNVQRTFGQVDSRTSWTDSVPIPVLILWLLFLLSIIFATPTLFVLSENDRIDILTYLIIGLNVLFPAILLFGLSRVSKWAWWATLFYFITFSVAFYYTYVDITTSFIDSTDFNDNNERKLAYQAIRVPLITGAAFLMAAFAYLFWIRKYFYPKPKELSESELLAS